ncbi:hypothetical protein L208DRAFT_1419626 [Tricholoma matsutake]|nr:hypothetical protein L208DRAFT_1419626 [Tricholoma matsutake 945]
MAPKTLKRKMSSSEFPDNSSKRYQPVQKSAISSSIIVNDCYPKLACCASSSVDASYPSSQDITPYSDSPAHHGTLRELSSDIDLPDVATLLAQTPGQTRSLSSILTWALCESSLDLDIPKISSKFEHSPIHMADVSKKERGSSSRFLVQDPAYKVTPKKLKHVASTSRMDTPKRPGKVNSKYSHML